VTVVTNTTSPTITITAPGANGTEVSFGLDFENVQEINEYSNIFYLFYFIYCFILTVAGVVASYPLALQNFTVLESVSTEVNNSMVTNYDYNTTLPNGATVFVS
jgi:hypothetical protein